MRRARALLLLGALVLPAPLALTAIAQDASQKLLDLQRQLEVQRQLRNEQSRKLQELRGSIEQLGAQQREALANIETLGEQIARLESEGRALAQRIGFTRDAVAELDSQIALTEAQVERLKTEVRLLMRNLYKERNARYLQLLSQARSLSDLMVRARYANLLGEQNVRVVNQLKFASERLAQQRDQQLTLQANLERDEADLQVKLAEQLEAQGQQQALLAQLQQSEEGQQALLLQTRAQSAMTSQSIDDLVGGIVQERARLEAERRAREEAERQRRAEEARRLREEQARLKREQERLAALERQRQEEARRRAQLQREEAERRAEQARQARERVEREQEAVQNRQDQLDRQDQRAQQNSAPLPSSVGRLNFPLAGGVVALGYGAEGPYQVLRSGSGAAVLAAADGEVLAETAYANEGWIVIVAHTPTMLTVYSGLQQPAVSTGSRVARGQVLGFVGGSPILGPDSMRFQVVTVDAGGQRRYVPPQY